MEAEIVAIGTELLLGVTVDTNSAYLANQLATVGVPVRRVTLVRDDLREIVAVLRDALQRTELVICSGGLGPTGDDLTREAIAQAVDRPLQFHQSLLDDIAGRFAAMRRTMSPSNRQQAYVPQGAHIIRNPRGTAPAFVAEHNGRSIAALPGVPQELRYLTEHELLPYLRGRYGLHSVLIVREIRVSGLSEAEAGERIADIMLGENPTVGITAKRGQHTIRIAAKAVNSAAAHALIQPLVDLMNKRFAGYILGEQPLEAYVVQMLRDRHLRLRLIENNVAAPVYRMLIKIEGGSDVLDKVHIVPEATINTDLHALSHDRADDTIALVVLAEQGAASIRPVHITLYVRGLAQPASMQRGIDFGLGQANEFIATTALDLVRRTLESQASSAASAS